jgi:hypothetical protein
LAPQITVQDFEDCGKVYICLKKNPEFKINQIAAATNLPLTRVKKIIEHLKYENLIPSHLFVEKRLIKDTGRERITEIFAPAPPEKVPVSNQPDQNDIPEKNETTIEKNNLFCMNCGNPVTNTYFDENNGICPRCYYQKILLESMKAKRRSGIYGSDRAGTW